MEQLIDLRGDGRGGGDWKRLAKEHICTYANPMGTDHSVVKVGGGGTGSEGEQGRGIGGGRKWSHR